MNVVDICIVILLLFGFFIGWSRGFTRQIVSVVGLILSIVLAFVFKDVISSFLYRICPFFDFGGYFKGVTSLNIVIYELIAFIIIFGLIMILYRIIVKLSSFLEKILNATIILGIPGKILGGIGGVLENFIIIFIILYVLNLPILNVTLVQKSNFATRILNNTPIISDVCKDTLQIYHEITRLKNEHSDDIDKTELNNEIVDLLLEHDFVSEDNVEYLIERGKLRNVKLED